MLQIGGGITFFHAVRKDLVTPESSNNFAQSALTRIGGPSMNSRATGMTEEGCIHPRGWATTRVTPKGRSKIRVEQQWLLRMVRRRAGAKKKN